MKRNLLGLVGLGLWPIQNADARHYPALRRTLVATEFVKSQKLIGLYGFCQICFLSYKPTNMVTNIPVSDFHDHAYFGYHIMETRRHYPS